VGERFVRLAFRAAKTALLNTSGRARSLRFPTHRAAFVASCLFLLFVSACGGDETRPGTAQTDALIVNMSQAPHTLDPAVVCASLDTGLVGSFYARLVRYGTKPGPDGTTQQDSSKIEPWLAKSWTVSDDGLVYTFRLREGMKFTGGKPVNAAAVKYTYERLLKMNQCGAFYILDGIYEPPLIKSIETPDPATVVITLSQPDVNALYGWAQPAAGIVDPSVVESHGGVQANKIDEWMASHVAGYGPYLLQSYEPNKQAVLVANPNFFEAPPSNKIIINYINSDATLLLRSRSGEADVTLGLSKKSVDSLMEDACCRVIVNDAATWELIGLPNDQPPFDNAKFREALTYAVPYEEILEKVAYGLGTLYYGPWPPAFPAFNEALSGAREFNPERARALIADSGVKLPVTVELSVIEGNSIEHEIATIVQSVWKDLGVNVRVQVLPSAEFTSSLEEHKLQAFMRYDGPSVLDPAFLWDYDGKCGVSFNVSNICIPDADKLMAGYRSTDDPAKRQQIADEVARKWIADSPRIQVFADKFAAVLSKDVTAYYFSASDLFDPVRWAK
jgi:peptide/nickel transport system substrate-binding protein